MENFDIKTIEQKIGYHFKRKDLIKNAFIHSSYANEHRAVKSNERLEFLGDSVLSVIVSEYIFKHSRKKEGELSKIRASLVCEKSLSFIFEQLELDKFIIKGEGLKKSKPTKAMMADAFEAVVAAIYLDGGLESAADFVLGVLDTSIKEIKTSGVPESNKSLLQERFKNDKIVYTFTTKGEGEEKTYFAKVSINGVVLGGGLAQKKRDAEELAAEYALKVTKDV